MNVGPVILRELRAESRNRVTWWTRLAGAIAGVFAMFTYSSEAPGIPDELIGIRLFHGANGLLQVGIWMLVPLLTADCIAREKREGTAGLLFLTPLTPLEVVVAKVIVHALRALGFLCGLAPVLAVPLLVGGVTGADVRAALAIQVSALALALGCGLLASALATRRGQATTLAIAISLTVALAFSSVAGLKILWALALGSLTGANADGYLWDLLMNSGVNIGWNGLPVPGSPSSGVAASVSFPWLLDAEWVAFASTLGTVAIVCLAARRLKKNWRVEPPSARAQHLAEIMVKPRFHVEFLRRRLRQVMDRNPIGWLHYHSWQGRIVALAWLLVIIAAECKLIYEQDLDLYVNFHTGLGAACLCGLAFSSASSFRAERENGAFELLLVSPLGVWQIIFGRLQAIWTQFVPALVAVVVGPLPITLQDISRSAYDVEGLALFASGFFSIAVIGTSFSLRRWNLLGAWAATCIVGIVIPILAAQVGKHWLPDVFGVNVAGIMAAIFLQWATAVWSLHWINGRLVHRRLWIAAG
jgi:ABC-type transport system involved in multi-copper enzyme maturation permease subunit